jgi:hypothetical protein
MTYFFIDRVDELIFIIDNTLQVNIFGKDLARIVL